MARTARNDVDYFPHKVDHGRKMYIIREKYKNDGYAVWFGLLEELGKADYHYLNLSDDTQIMYLSALLMVTEQNLLNIIADLVKLGEFDEEFWKNGKILFNEHFCKEISDAYAKRANSVITRSGLFQKLTDKGILNGQLGMSLLDNRGQSGGINSHTIVKDTIEEDSKEYITAFDKFWNIYPKRKGKKVGKQNAFKNFKKIPIESLPRVIKNAGNYGINNDYAKDPERFLKNDFWKDWDEPPEKPLTLEQKAEARFGKD